MKVQAKPYTISSLSFWAQLGSSNIKLELLGSAWLEQYQIWAFGLSSAPANQASSHLGSVQLDQKLLARPSLHVPVWHPSITGEQRLEIERVQKSAFHIILGECYRSYTSSLKALSMATLHSRRVKLCKKFARKSAKSEKCRHWFKVYSKPSFTRTKPYQYCPVFSRTVRYEKSPISYLTTILNSAKWYAKWIL